MLPELKKECKPFSFRKTLVLLFPGKVLSRSAGPSAVKRTPFRALVIRTKPEGRGSVVGGLCARILLRRMPQTPKLDPQPQVFVAFGLLNVKPRPFRPSVKSTSQPIR